MPAYFNISIGLTVFMGLAAGGLLALALMSSRGQQTGFAIMFGLAMLLAAGGSASLASYMESLEAGVINGVVLLVFAFFLGYALTTYSVLSERRNDPNPGAAPGVSPPPGRQVVICVAPGEPPDYTVRNAALRLSLADDALDTPPVLLRPFYMREIKGKFASLKRSPYRDYQEELSKKLQAHLENTHTVYWGWYSDEPRYADVVAAAVKNGARQITICEVHVADAPDAVLAGESLAPLRLDRLGVQVTHTGVLANAELLAQIYVRRVLEAVPQMQSSADQVGLLLVGRGHPVAGDSSVRRFQQEDSFLRKVRVALLKAGFAESQIATGWLRYGPSCAEALSLLVAAKCTTVFWMPSSFAADSVRTLYDVPAQIEEPARAAGVKLVPLGAWNADDLAVEELAARVRAASRTGSRLAPVR